METGHARSEESSEKTFLTLEKREYPNINKVQEFEIPASYFSEAADSSNGPRGEVTEVVRQSGELIFDEGFIVTATIDNIISQDRKCCNSWGETKRYIDTTIDNWEELNSLHKRTIKIQNDLLTLYHLPWLEMPSAVCLGGFGLYLEAKHPYHGLYTWFVVVFLFIRFWYNRRLYQRYLDQICEAFKSVGDMKLSEFYSYKIEDIRSSYFEVVLLRCRMVTYETSTTFVGTSSKKLVKTENMIIKKVFATHNWLQLTQKDKNLNLMIVFLILAELIIFVLRMTGHPLWE